MYVPFTLLIILEWTFTETSETSWERAWGITTGFTYSAWAEVSASFLGGGASAGASWELSLEVNYNGKKGGNNGTSKTTTIRDTTAMTVPSKKKVTASLLVELLEDAAIPFTATIRRTSEIGTTFTTARGTWLGVMKLNSMIHINEEDPGDNSQITIK